MTTISINNIIFKDLTSRYNKTVLNKKELANELNCSVSAINNYIAKGYGIPSYKKMGNAKNARIVFPIAYVASYLTQTIAVA